MINNFGIFLIYTFSFAFVQNLFKVDSLKSLFNSTSFNEIQNMMKSGSMVRDHLLREGI